MIEDRAHPEISVIVCTRNHAGGIVNAVHSILASHYPRFELLLVDESDDNATADALAPLRQNNPRLRYLRLGEQGKARALNHALHHARGQYLALTDDDCEMAPDCLSAMVAAFEADPSVAIIFGDVAPSRPAGAHEHIPKYRFYETHAIRSPADFLKIRIRRGGAWLNFGIGANMAVRAAALRAIGGWDPCIGPGEKFGSGDDHDVAFRLLLAGHGVQFSPSPRVVHYGMRLRSDLGRYTRRIGRGFGAACVKHLKCGVLYRGSGRALMFHAMTFCSEALHRRRSEGASFVRGWLSGFFRGLFHPVDKRTGCFKDDRAIRS
jgi:GT2 family glycosyltransferase